MENGKNKPFVAAIWLHSSPSRHLYTGTSIPTPPSRRLHITPPYRRPGTTHPYRRLHPTPPYRHSVPTSPFRSFRLNVSVRTAPHDVLTTSHFSATDIIFWQCYFLLTNKAIKRKKTPRGHRKHFTRERTRTLKVDTQRASHHRSLPSPPKDYLYGAGDGKKQHIIFKRNSHCHLHGKTRCLYIHAHISSRCPYGTTK